MKKSIAVLAVAFVMCISSKAQVLHLIEFCNTLDEKIGVSCIRDHDIVRNEASILADYIEYNIQYYDYFGAACSRENLMSVLNDINVTNNDIVMFYYSGHGVHAAADAGSLPQMCLKYSGYEQDKFVPVRTVDEMLSKKNPRLSIIITDCCNNIAEWVSAKGLIEAQTGNTTIKEADAKYYKKLFCGQKGKVIITGSKKGQYSWCNNNGGFFTLSFWDTLLDVGLGNIQPDWTTVAAKVSRTTLGKSDNKQEPYYSVNVHDINDPVIPNPVINHVDTDMSIVGILSEITDLSKSASTRLSLANEAKAYFTPEAKVKTVGRNMTTTVDYEDASAYLMRICASKRIKSINVIRADKGTNEKYSYLIVHEIYNE